MEIKSKLLDAMATATAHKVTSFELSFESELKWLQECLLKAAKEGKTYFILTQDLATEHFPSYEGNPLHITKLHQYLSIYFTDITVSYHEWCADYWGIIRHIRFRWYNE